MSVVDRPSGAARTWPVLVAVLAAVAVGAAAAVAVYAVPGEQDATPLDLLWLSCWLSFAVVGALVLGHQPGHGVGLAFLGVGTLVPVAGLVDVLTFWAADRVGDDATVVAYLRLGQSVAFTAAFGLVACTVLLLPDGRLARPWMRWPARAAFGAALGQTVVAVIAPGPVGENLPIDNPLGIAGLGGLLDVVEGVCAVLLGLGVLTGLLSLVLRTRRATPVARPQLAWLALGVLVVVGINALAALTMALGMELSDDAGALVAALTLPVIPVCIAVATLRHNLYDAELLLRRSLVFSVLSGGVLVSYLGLAAALGQTAAGQGASALLGGALALAVLPLRTKVQRLLDRRFYGESGDPYGVLTGLGRQLSDTVAPDEVPALVAHSVRGALRVPWAAVEVGAAGEVLLTTESGERPTWPPTSIPLTVHGAEVGRLLVSPRRATEPLETRDLRLLDDLAGQVAVAVAGLNLTRDLQRSREELVLTREEERRRLRNDLHDGLGPVLAGVVLQLGVAREQTGDVVVAEVLDVAEQRLVAAVGDLRRLVYGLRPPALDELGLAGALREHVASSSAGLPLVIQLNVPEPLPPLAAAIEVAAFRVASEALTNVVRHSRATACVLDLRVEHEQLVLQVRDDGEGLRGPVGIGLSSMRERCVEVGGCCDVGPAVPRGTVVTARLPLSGPGG